MSTPLGLNFFFKRYSPEIELTYQMCYLKSLWKWVAEETTTLTLKELSRIACKAKAAEQSYGLPGIFRRGWLITSSNYFSGERLGLSFDKCQDTMPHCIWMHDWMNNSAFWQQAANTCSRQYAQWVDLKSLLPNFW